MINQLHNRMPLSSKLSASTSCIACAGWNIPKHAAAHFPVEGSHLQRYASVFNAVEINSSFYRPHKPQTYARWADSVPPEFRFAVKLIRDITHQQRLVDIREILRQFAAQVSMLNEKLGCVLVQLAPSLSFDHTIADAFFIQMRSYFNCMLACEARHPSWFDDAASLVLQKHAITRVIADPAAGQTGEHVPTTAQVYIRLHGTPRVYYSAYSDTYLARLADDLSACRQAGRDAWCVFDNTAEGAAISNGLFVLDRLAGRKPPLYLPQDINAAPAGN